ncbi:metallophosphoesterase MPPED2-like [Ptychodera flava]|uniref:metallophosphoesterase MPPED2-like n=1 Tax=Ptychodera flava TaxID=63121 RepID=UPI00396A1A36
MAHTETKADISDSHVTVHPLTDKPTKLWSKLKVKSTVNKVTPLSHDAPKPEGHTRFVCVSDTHSQTHKMDPLPDGDVLIHAGDFTQEGLPQEVVKFNDWLGTLPYKHKIVIAGNHELSFDPVTIKSWQCMQRYDESELKDMYLKLTNCTYLEDSETNVLGFRIYGSPWQPEFFDWSFNLPRGQPMLDVWNKIPEGIDILITHGPPLGHGDKTMSEQRAGCMELLNTIQKRVKPKYHIFGHIHEGYGVTSDGYTTYINASTCTLRYRPINKPVIFDLPNPS